MMEFIHSEDIYRAYFFFFLAGSVLADVDIDMYSGFS